MGTRSTSIFMAGKREQQAWVDAEGPPRSAHQLRGTFEPRDLPSSRLTVKASAIVGCINLQSTVDGPTFIREACSPARKVRSNESSSPFRL